ncbi:pentatricopeptide repeat-containing protein At2g20540-like [Phalaenopsis equestris]|uniref:pentatricopeptide repeat-containing protein At2g20540-like n=1 Tax=Phalaenopsis equestris TaxID=78828 RepID=UPI0009E297DB|nr:pentatricopeptide repeat-containing protein At2g20540-like [Phalaenopsis equestris]XP_020582503.1 pentatricopeptide repeat-containing protein At2g20540-like [Phalaenopsis equestris]XP_020582504.1 pentatricopeptide repeat-containing protein At2g20540-like [Phalaenopsis equestris]
MPAILNSILNRIDSCSSLNSLKQIQANTLVHGLGSNNLVAVKLLTFCSQTLGLIGYTRCIFDTISSSANVYLWTAMISSYSHQQSELSREAVEIFRLMLNHGTHPNNFTFSTVLKACSTLKAISEGKQIQAHSTKLGFNSAIYVQTALLDMYAKFSLVDEARCLFDSLEVKNVAACNVMIACHIKDGDVESARRIFDRMTRRDTISFATLISGYSMNGTMRPAREVFDQMPVKEVNSWNSLLVGYIHGGEWIQSMKLFNEMQVSFIKPNNVTMAIILSSCGQLGALGLGSQLHAFSHKFCFLMNVYVNNSLVNMYAKCGSLQEAHNVFVEMPEKDIVSFNAMITGLANHGLGKKALELFGEVIQTGLQPDSVTFMGILTACSQCGLIESSRHYFECMRSYSIEPSADHYASFVDLLGRMGLIEKAYEFVKTVKVEGHAGVWGALFNACRSQSNVGIGRIAAKELFKLEPENSGNYVILSNIYAGAHLWDGVREVRCFMREKGVAKIAGCSWIEVNNEVFEFVMWERGLDFLFEEMYAILGQLSLQIMLLNWECY